MIKVLVICNPFAGGGTASLVLTQYQEFAATQKTHQFYFYKTSQPGDYQGMDAEVNRVEPEIISIVGGDGSINEVLNVSSVRTRKIHLVAAGSGNDFHRLVYGSIDHLATFQKVLSAQTQLYDVGTCNGRYFLNGVGIGFDGSVARETMRMKLPVLSSKWKYWIAIFKNVLFYRSVNTTITIDGKPETNNVFMVAIANGTDYGGGFKVSPKSDASDGLLNLVIVYAIGPLKRLFKIPKVQAGKHLEESFVAHKTVKKVRLEADTMLHAHLDGEQMSAHRFDIQIEQGMRFVV